MVERLVRNEKVRGSNPLTSTAKPGGKKIKSAERDLRIDSGGHKGINPLTSTGSVETEGREEGLPLRRRGRRDFARFSLRHASSTFNQNPPRSLRLCGEGKMFYRGDAEAAENLANFQREPWSGGFSEASSPGLRCYVLPLRRLHRGRPT